MKNSEDILRELGPRLAGDVLVDELSLVVYSTAACIYKIRPLAVVLPRDAQDVSSAVRYAAEHGIPVWPRGAATGLSGQVLGRGIILDFTRYMNQVEELHPGANFIRVQPGAILGKVNQQLKPLGKRIPQDPASEEMCSIGGNVGNNAGGLRAFKIGSTKHHVRGLEVVLSDGTIAWIRPLRPGSPEAALAEADTGTFGRVWRETNRLLQENEALIASKRPRMEKSTAGYDLFSIYHDGLIDLTRLIVGSEGSLAVVTDVELGLFDLPKHAATALLYFDTLEKAGAAVEHILKFDPIAVEFMEKNFLDIVRREKAVSEEYLPQQAEAVLLVEFALESPEKNRAALRSMAARVADELKLSFTWREAYDARQQELLWKLRKAVQPILYKLPPPKQITGFIEDSVIPPARLAEYIRGLWAIFKKHGVEAATFGHAGDANLHVRPLLDLRTQQDIDKMVAMADEANNLVLRLGGTLSGEHGDGRVRSPYLRRQFGPVYDLMRQVKRIWDPQGLLAPENVITDRTQISTDDLRLGASYHLVETGSDYDRPAMRLEAEKCHGCGTCLAYCPVYLASGEPLAAPRAKCNILQAVISGELDFHKLGLDPRFKAVADLCYNCKTCRVECPSNVNAAALMLVEKAHWARHKGLPLADRLFSRARLVAKLGSLTAPLSNSLARWPLVQKLGRELAGIAARPMPRFSRDTLESYVPQRASGATPKPGATAATYAAVRPGTGPGTALPAHQVALFAGCFYIFNDAAAGRALVDVLRALGCEVVLPEQRCCGLPAYTSGDRLTALKDAEFNLAVLAPLVEAGYDIVSGCPSCTLSLREDYPELLNVEESRKVSGAVYDAHEYVAKLLDERKCRVGGSASGGGPQPLSLEGRGRPGGPGEGDVPREGAVAPDRGGRATRDFRTLRLAYHAPCHLRALGLGAKPKELLEQAGLKFHLVNTTCCGMGGTFGLKQKNLELSNKIAADFFKRLRDAHIDAVVTPCGMCKTQIEGQTGLRVYHPMELLAKLLEKEAVTS